MLQEEAEKFLLKNGDVLIVEGHANVDEIGRAALWRAERDGILHQNHLIRVRCLPDLSPEYLNLYLNSVRGRAYFKARAKSSSGLNTINSSVVKDMPVPAPALVQQLESVREAQKFDCNLASLSKATDDLIRSQKTYLQEVFA